MYFLDNIISFTIFVVIARLKKGRILFKKIYNFIELKTFINAEIDIPTIAMRVDYASPIIFFESFECDWDIFSGLCQHGDLSHLIGER